MEVKGKIYCLLRAHWARDQGAVDFLSPVLGLRPGPGVTQVTLARRD